MLSLEQLNVINNFANEFIELIRVAIKTKPIKRVSRRQVNGKFVDTKFEAPVNASGNLANTLRYEITDTSLSIWANDYIYDLVYGKKPSQVDITTIKNWLNDKGISEIDTNQDTLARLVSTKIARFGSSIYLATQGNNSGLLDNILSEQIKSEYNANFAKAVELELQSTWQRI